jgi:hypothetical protein
MRDRQFCWGGTSSLCESIIKDGCEQSFDQHCCRLRPYHIWCPLIQRILAVLEKAALVSKTDDGCFKATVLCMESVKACAKLVTPLRVAAVRSGIEIEEYTVWELLCSLDVQGWVHLVKPSSKHETPYDPSDAGPKIWYSAPRASSLSQPYLAVLLKGTKPVEHGHTSGYYHALLNGIPFVSKRVMNVKFHSQCDDDWNAGAAKLKAVRHRRAGKAPRRSAARKAAMPPDVESGDDSKSSSKSAISSSSSSSSSRSNSSSSRSSDGSAKSVAPALGGASSSGDPPLAGAVVAAGGPPRDAADKDHDTGLNHLTMTFNSNTGHSGWEMKCHHPDHQQPRTCRKRLALAVKGRTADHTKRMLLTWASWGASEPDRQMHMDDIWQRVLTAHSDGTLPELVDIQPARSFLRIHGEVVQPARAKRARLQQSEIGP